MWRRKILATGESAPSPIAPWYRRPDVWVVVGAIVLPFGWLLAVARITWAYARSRRTDSR